MSPYRAAPPDGTLAWLLDRAVQTPASRLGDVVDIVAAALGADRARVLVADYALLSLQELGTHGPTSPHELIEGTLAGRSFISSEIVVAGTDPPMVCVPLSEGSERLGVLELVHRSWEEVDEDLLSAVVQVLVLVLISKRRYSDVVLRSRRTEPLSVAAELQWDLLPPLACSTDEISVSGIVEPAYSIGGDSFDYALNGNTVELAIIDAVGHGMQAVMTSVAAINCLRNARREGAGLETAYLRTAEVIESQFGDSTFVTAQVCSLTLDTGELVWLNAGHPLPLLVRDGTFQGELPCLPSLPMGVGGPVTEIATTQLQRGDRVLFYTDGVVETRGAHREAFGVPRLADFLVRATLDGVAPAETVRRLSSSILRYNGAGLSDDATLLLVEYHGPES